MSDEETHHREATIQHLLSSLDAAMAQLKILSVDAMDHDEQEKACTLVNLWNAVGVIKTNCEQELT